MNVNETPVATDTVEQKPVKETAAANKPAVATQQPQVVAAAKPQVKTNTSQPRPVVNEPVVREVSVSEKLIKERLTEYASSVSTASVPSEKSVQYKQLHAAFRTLLAQRGDEFTACFKTFIGCLRAALKGEDGMNVSAFAPNVYALNLKLFTDSNEGRAFVAFMVLAISYAKSNDRANFAKNKNIGRLTNMIADMELQQLLYEAFGAR